MRRGSIVGPIILILIGLLFLANNLRPDVPMLEFLGQYWPFLLIGWGLVRLIEILIWAVRGKLCRPKGVSGGEWVLVVFLSLLERGLYAFPFESGMVGTVAIPDARNRDVRRGFRLYDRRTKDYGRKDSANYPREPARKRPDHRRRYGGRARKRPENGSFDDPGGGRSVNDSTSLEVCSRPIRFLFEQIRIVRRTNGM